MGRLTPKAHIPAELITKLRRGPASLSASDHWTQVQASHDLRDQFSNVQIDITAKQAEAVRKVLFKNYTLWLETWIIPELQRLVPEVKQVLAPKVIPGHSKLTVEFMERMKSECEARFQAGHSKVQVVSEKGGWVRDFPSGTKAVTHAFRGELVFARRKIVKDGSGKYGWVFLGIGT